MPATSDRGSHGPMLGPSMGPWGKVQGRYQGPVTADAGLLRRRPEGHRGPAANVQRYVLYYVLFGIGSPNDGSCAPLVSHEMLGGNTKRHELVK